MNIQLKQKIIGVIIIVIFVAIAIPVLLSGTRSKPNTTETAQLDIQQDATTETIALTEPVQPVIDGDSASSQQAVIVDTSSTTTSADTTTQTVVATNDTDTNSTTAAIAMPSATPAATTATDTTTTAGTTSSVSTPKKPEAQNSHKNTVTKIAKNKHKPQVKTLANKSWSIDLGKYSNKQKAQNLVAKLKKSGYHAYAKKVTIKHKNLTMVLVGPVKNHEKTAKLAQKITKNFGIKAKVISA